MIATHAPPEELIDDTPAEVALSAALNVWGADLVTSSGQIAEQFARDGKIDPWLLAGIKRAVARLNEAVAEFAKEKPPHA